MALAGVPARVAAPSHRVRWHGLASSRGNAPRRQLHFMHLYSSSTRQHRLRRPPTAASPSQDSLGPEQRQPSPAALRAACSPAALAFLGDAVWELEVRGAHLLPARRLGDYHDAARAEVRAEAQARCHDALAAGGSLSAAEREVLRWGANAQGGVPRRLAGAAINRQTYRKATAVECLFGYLHVCEPGRGAELMRWLRCAGALPPAA